jgi:hypothetical protein
MILAGIGLFGSGLFPPISPAASPHAVMHLYASHPTRMRAGLLLAIVAFGGWAPWVAAISTQLRRIRNVSPVLSNLQLVAGVTSWVVLMVPLLIFSAVAYRPLRDPNVLQGINDVAWIMFIMPVVPFIVQALAIGIAVLEDRSSKPLFPRWFGYLNIWVAILEMPGCLLTFFKTGPFDWRGLLALWIPFAAFGAWIFATSYAVDRAVLQEKRELSEEARELSEAGRMMPAQTVA